MFISELFERNTGVPNNPKQKQGPAGQARGTDKAPFRNKLVGEARGDTIEAYGIRGLSRSKWRRSFRNHEALAAWCEKYDAEVFGVRDLETASIKEDAEGLNIGDPVIITGNVEFKGATGDIVDFGSGNRFVVVNLYNHGKHSFHSSDVSYNEYADSDEEEARMYDNGDFRDDFDEAEERMPQYADPDFSKPMFEGNPQDEITMDVPLLIRLLEYAREDAKTDMDLHNVAEQLIKLSGQGCLSMDQYDQIVGGMQEGFSNMVKGVKRKIAGKQDPKEVQYQHGFRARQAIDASRKFNNQAAYDNEKKMVDRYNKVHKVVNKESNDGYTGRKDVPGFMSGQ